MKAFLFADLHVNYRVLDDIKRYLASHSDIGLIIFAGDLVNMGEPIGFVEQFINVINKIGLPLFWVPGNNDFGRGYYKLMAKFPSLEGKIVEFKGRSFCGVGGSPASWSGQYAGESLIDKKKIAGTIFVSHVPPPGVHNYVKGDCQSPTLQKNPKLETRNSKEKENSIIGNWKLEIGNSSAKRLADSPLIHICGHIQYQWGCAYLGSTKIIKLAQAEAGYYAILDLETLEVEFNRF
jgi:Icc-related predicted phosphoesterase